MKVFEVGTYEQYEGGFHAFYRTLTESKAHKILLLAKEHQARIPKLNLFSSDEDHQDRFMACSQIDSDFMLATGLDFKISQHDKDEYDLVMHGFDLDE